MASRTIRARRMSSSLGAFFTRGFERADGRVGTALETFVEGFIGGDLSGVFPRNQLSYGYRHWFPLPSTGGACKRILFAATHSRGIWQMELGN